MGEELDVPSGQLYDLLINREKESTTVMNPDLAIPHIILEGEHKFDILLVRCREGIRFSEEYPAVHTVFVLVGSKDERSFHLRTLASIAQIVQDPHFEDRWMKAKSEQALRDLVLLGKRRRH
jgi:mannitol/fructose-specific phosphotransferase system IIA component (Ntr-type)